MKLLFRLVIALVICGMAIPAMATPVQADPGFSVKEGSISKNEGYVGDEIRIYGSWDKGHGRYAYIYYELYNEDEDDWPYEKVEYDEYDETEERYEFDCKDFEIPESCMGKHDILICDDDDPDDDIDTVEFTVCPFIEIDEDEGPAGTTVEVNGKGYDKDESEIEIRFYLQDPDDDYDNTALYDVAWSGDITVDDYGSWEDVIFEVPRGKGGKHWIYAVGDEADDIENDNIRGVTFEVLPGISVDAEEGFIGDTVTVTGSGFEQDEEDIKVTYDGDVVAKDIEADEDGCWTGSFDVPESAKGKHKIDAYGKKTKTADIEDKDFTVKPKVTLTPTEGHVGTIISFTGNGFAASKSVTITYGDQVASSTTDSKGSFPTVTFEAKGTHGEQPITATDAAGNMRSLTFVMESTAPPKPTLSSPTNDSRVGFIRKVTPTFQWQAVDDPSGVSYNLEISTSAGFALVLISKTNLAQASYTLIKEEALSYGTYYWRVKAIDGAQNDSGWSTVYSFKSGLLPLWAFIAIVALIAVLVGILLYFLVFRRRATYD